MITRLKHISFIAAIWLFLLFSCGKSSTSAVVFEEEEKEATDSTCEWLSVHNNFYEPNYYSVLKNYYANKIEQKDYAMAAKALKTVCDAEMYYLFFDDNFYATVQSFDSLYGDKLSWHKTVFVDELAGYRLMDEGEFRGAIVYFKRATAQKPFDYGTYMDAANIYSDIAFCYSAIGDQELALRYNYQALFYFNQTGSVTGQGGVYDNIALVHMFTKNYKEAEVYFDKAMQAYKESGDSSNMFNTLHNRIILYQETNHPRKYNLIDSTYKAFKESAEEDLSLGVALSSFYVDMLLHENRIAEAKQILDEIKVSVEKLHSSSADGDYHVALAQYQLKTNAGIKDILLMKDALKTAEETDHYQNQLSFCEVLKADAMLRGDYKRALEYSEKEKIALNGLANREMVSKTMELNQQHETEKKVQYIALQEETILTKNTTIALLLTILIVFCLTAAIIYNIQKQKKIRTESQRAVLYTRQLLEKTEEERKRIASDLHDSVSHELLILKNAIGNQQETGNKIDAIINDIRVISRNLHPIMFEKVGLVASIEQLVERSQSTYDLMVSSDISYDAFLSTSDELQLYRIIQEALSNTIKYSRAFAAKILVFERNEVLHVELIDNGKGFDVNEKLSGNTAFGLHNIIERSKAIGGVAKIHSDKNGTVITIEIKKKA